MPIVFDKKVIKTTQVGRVKQTTVQMSRHDKQLITMNQVASITKSIQTQADKKKENIKLMVRGLNADKWYTIKNMDSDLNEDEVEEYMDQFVDNTVKFKDFFQIHVTVYK